MFYWATERIKGRSCPKRGSLPFKNRWDAEALAVRANVFLENKLVFFQVLE